MSDCPQLEDLLKEGSGGHAAQCRECRDLLDALAHVDAALDSAFGSVYAPPDLEAAVRERIARLRGQSRPSVLPEILDLIGWAAVLAAAAVAVPYFSSLLTAFMAAMG